MKKPLRMFIGGAREPSDLLFVQNRCVLLAPICLAPFGAMRQTDDGKRPEHAAATWNTVGVGKESFAFN